MYDEFFAAITQFLILGLQRLADVEQIKTLLLPDGCNRGVITLEHLELKFHLLHLLNDLLRLYLLFDQFMLEDAHLSLLLVLDKPELISEVLCNTCERTTLLVLLAKNTNKLISVNVLVHFELIDLVL